MEGTEAPTMEGTEVPTMEGTEVPTMAGPEAPEVKFTSVDYTLFILMLVASMGIGVVSAFRSRGKASTQEYLLGGRNMSPVPVAFSLLGGSISAISILGNPTEIYFFGTQLSTSLLGCIPGCIFVHQVVVPTFYHLKLVSINEYLQVRFGSRLLRTLATLCLLLVNFIYMGMCLYAPTLALSTVTGIATWASTLIMGVICTFYITIGGVKAVVYTDVLQTLLMFGGVLVVGIICCVDLGGVGNVWTIAEQGGRISFFDLNTSPYERHTLLSTVMFGFYIMLSGVGFSQTVYQRLASVRTMETAKRLVVFFLVGLYLLWIVFYFSGLVAFATYSDCDPLTSGKIEKPDQIVPFLVTDKLSHLTGLSGIFVAAVYGGVLSTLSSCGNSFACVIWEDFLKDRPYFRRLSDAKATNVVKFLSAASGVLAICMGLMVEKLGSIFHVANSILSAISGPLHGVFLSGICAPWMNAKGAIVGFVASFTFSVWVVIGKFVRGGGSPPRLPLSIEGCQEGLQHLANTTVTTFLANTTLTDALMANSSVSDALLDDTHSIEGSSTKTIYEISYCYSGVIGMALTIAVGTLVSLITGPTCPKEVDGVVNPACGRAYQRLWDFLKSRRAKEQRIVIQEEELKMLGISTVQNLNTPS
ncbi:sodium-coupled monocarboxylate transporter 1-like isoform X2 [Procambarus clarkii]